MIEKITFAVGSHDVETLTGESLNIINELMRSGHSRYGFHQTLKTGRPLFKQELDGGQDNQQIPSSTVNYDPNPAYTSYDRIISYVHRHSPKQMSTQSDSHSTHHSTWWDSLERPGTVFPHESTHFSASNDLDCVAKEGKRLSIPLGLFFTSHPSKYFPIAAIAGCNDIRVSIKFRPVKEVLMQKGTFSQNDTPNHGPVYRNPETGAAYKAIQLHVGDLASALADVTSSAEWTFNPARLVIAPGTVTFANASASGVTPVVTATALNVNYAVFEFKTVLSSTGKYRVVSVTQTAPGNIADITSATYAYYTGARTSTTYGTYDSTTGPTRWQKGSTTTPDTTKMRIEYNAGSGSVINEAPRNDPNDPPVPTGGNWFKRCQLRCHYIHVTGPEATSLMNKEHVRLMKLMDDTNHLTKQFKIKCTTKGFSQKLALDLNFLNPVQ
jgi:hypothetical protein